MTSGSDTSRTARKSELVVAVGMVVLIAAIVTFGVLKWQAGDAPVVEINADEWTRKQPTETLTIHGRAFELELAVGREQTSRGMMGRAYVEPNRGMLFVFPEARTRWFWMKNCLIDLDVIFLDGEGRVVSWTTMQAPPAGTPDAQLKQYPSGGAARFAIELRAGTADKLGLETGQIIEGPWERLKRLAG